MLSTSEGLVNRSNTVIQFITVLLIFAFVILITWFTTQWIAKIQSGQASMMGANLEVVETKKVAQDKYLQIVRAGDKYLVLGIGKNEISCLAELKSDELELSDRGSKSSSFNAIFDRVKGMGKIDSNSSTDSNDGAQE